MKIHLNIGKQFEEIEVHINANEYNEEVEQLMKKLKTNDINVIAGYHNNDIHMLKVDDIFSIYAEGTKVFFQTDEEEYESKQRVYELEHLLQGDFVRITKSTLVNVSKISFIKMGALGSTLLFLENESSIPVSRTYIKELKKVLGIRRD